MWVDARGVAHTVASPEPHEHLAPALLAALSAADPETLERVESVLSGAEDDIYSDLPRGPVGPVGEGLPAELVIGEGYDGSAPLDEYAHDLVASTDSVWRLDVVMALTDVVDALLDPDDDDGAG